jgi:inhibitor of cysteine peptidase
MLKRNILTLGLVVALAAGLVACDDGEGDDNSGAGQAAIVESIEVLLLESFPLQANAIVRGNLPDGCTTIQESSAERQGDTYEITIRTVRPPQALCTEALVPFEEAVPLDILGLEAGTYTVEADGASASFELAVDNVSQ